MSAKNKTAKQLANQETVLRLKRTLNPITGLPYTYQEIAAKLGVTPMTPHRYVPKPIRDKACPQCLRELETEVTP